MKFIPPPNTSTVGEYLTWATDCFDHSDVFFGHGTDNPWDEAVVLVTKAVGETPFVDQSIANRVMSDAESECFVEWVNQRISKRIPAAYLVGEAWFAGLPFRVNDDVLIPRSPIAELIHNQFRPWLRDDPKTVLDLCCGSGCIGIACAYAFEKADVILSDISAGAIAVAIQNITLHDLENRVRSVRGDLFGGLQNLPADSQRFDLIVSNPPYVNAADISSMPQEYHHEPAIGLGSGHDGLDITRRILSQARQHLNPGGILVVEVGNSWPALDTAFPELPFNWIEFENGGHGVFVLDRDDLPFC
ncbi:MAG: 50S ribosomal protein L3 N(5)-glutamine methyltransferase [bacterium]